MKKGFVLVAVTLTVVIFACAFVVHAESIDFSKMSNEALQALIDSASKELNDREQLADNTVENTFSLSRGGEILNWEEVSITFEAGYDMQERFNLLKGDDDWCLEVIGVVENNSSAGYEIYMGETKINGWLIGGNINLVNGAGSKIPSHSKVKMRFTFDLEDAEIKKPEAINDFEAVFQIYSSETYDVVYKTEPIKIIP